MKTVVLALVGALSLVPAQHAAAATQQTLAAPDFDYYGWGNAWWNELAGVKLAQNTTAITGLTGSATTWDQGWGGQTDDNGLHLVLMKGNEWLWRDLAAGGRHGAQTISYTAGDGALASLNTALAGIDWSTAPDVRMTVWANAYGWGGWELHTRAAAYVVTSEATAAVPEPATWAMMIGGFGLVGGVMRRRSTAVRFA